MVIYKIRNKFNEFYSEYLSNNSNFDNEEEKEMLELIKDLIKDDNCFYKIDMNLALNILVSIGYTKEDSIKIYKELLNESRQRLNGKYILISSEK